MYAPPTQRNSPTPSQASGFLIAGGLATNTISKNQLLHSSDKINQLSPPQNQVAIRFPPLLLPSFSPTAFIARTPTDLPSKITNLSNHLLQISSPPSRIQPSTTSTINAISFDQEAIPIFISAKKKYKPVALKIKPVLDELPAKFRILQNIIGDPGLT